MEPIKLEFSYTRKELYKGIRESLFSRGGVYWVLFLMWLGFLLVELLMVYDVTRYGPPFPWYFWLFLFLLWIPIQLYGITPLILVNRNFNSTENKTGYFYLVDDEKIHFNYQYVDGNLKWKIFKSVLESQSNFFLVYADSGRKLILPRRAFTSLVDENAFRELASQKTGSYRKLNQPSITWLTILLVLGIILFFCVIFSCYIGSILRGAGVKFG